MDLLSVGHKWLHSVLPKVAGTEVVYEVPGEGQCFIKPLRAERTHELVTVSGINLSVKSRDWIVTKSELVINGHAVMPGIGHVIRAEGVEYEVCPIGDGEPCARDSDRYGNAWRIHTQVVGVT